MFSHIVLFLYYTDDSRPEGQIYADARSYLLLEIELSKPLVPKKPASVIANRFVRLVSFLNNDYLIAY